MGIEQADDRIPIGRELHAPHRPASTITNGETAFPRWIGDDPVATSPERRTSARASDILSRHINNKHFHGWQTHLIGVRSSAICR